MGWPKDQPNVVFFGAWGSVLPDVAGGIAIAGRVVSGVVQVLDVRVVSTEGVGGSSRNLGSGSVGGGVVVVVLRSHGGTTGDDDNCRSGQNRKSHDMVLVFCFSNLSVEPPNGQTTHISQTVEPSFDKFYIADS
jgi:hypothetical protein